jgi:hypothetical protein
MTHLAWIHPPLIRSGDRLTLDDFLDRWGQMPGLKSAELLDGTVYMPSPVSKEHMRVDSRLQALCGLYCLKTLGVESGTNGTWLLTSATSAQPDCSIHVTPEYGGRSTTRHSLALGVPEFVAEICHSSRAYDLGPKLALYQSAGVNEYLAVLVEERRFEWRILVDGSYEPLKDDGGVYRSPVLPGLWIDSNAFWSEDSERVLQTLEQGLASKEHQDFVERLRKSRESATL